MFISFNCSCCRLSLHGLLWFLLPCIQKACIKPQNCVRLFSPRTIAKKEKYDKLPVFRSQWITSPSGLSYFQPQTSIHARIKSIIFLFSYNVSSWFIQTCIYCHPCRNKTRSCSYQQEHDISAEKQLRGLRFLCSLQS